MTIVIGAIADDFTGASDLANTLVQQGMRVVQVIGTPQNDLDLKDAQAVVIALKSRTAPVNEAVSSALEALVWLRQKGAKQIFFKYCSTFDSTDEGNIGPVSDALLDATHSDFALVCPAFPENGRRVFQGHLFVHDLLLSDSSMKDHPLTPMTDSNLQVLMRAQSNKQIGLIAHDVVSQGASAIVECVKRLKSEGVSFAIIDAISNSDLITIGTVAAEHTLVTGGSGIALGIPKAMREAGHLTEPIPVRIGTGRGRKIVLAGSCSSATRAQIKYVADKWPCRMIDVDDIYSGRDVVGEVVRWSSRQPDTVPVLIYASTDPENVAETQKRYGKDAAGAMVEETLSLIGRYLVDCGANRIIVAGGETSGAVVSALKIKALEIGQQIAPGVPWTQSLGKNKLMLAMKSGNFGGDDFFEYAFEVLDD
jgi:uncharacterized protein YgbK (DUF1537 family)